MRSCRQCHLVARGQVGDPGVQRDDFHSRWPQPIFNVFQYITFRTAGASVTAVALSLVLSGTMVALALRGRTIVVRRKGVQPIMEASPSESAPC